MRSRWLSYLAELLALAGLYFGAAKWGLDLGLVEQVSAVWPPTGIALAAILLCGYRAWPGIAAGAFLVNAMASEPPLVAAGIAVGNTLEAILGAWLLQRIAGFRNALDRVRDVLGLITLAALLSTTVSASLGVACLCLGGVQPWTHFGMLWGVWWLGDLAGDLIMAPLLLTWALAWRGRGLACRPIELVALVTGLVGVCLVVFAGGFTFVTRDHPLEYTIFPFVIWAALRCGPPATALVTFVACGLAIWGTVHGFGPFATGQASESLVLLQTFMGVIAVTGLVLAAGLAERRQAGDSLRHSHRLLQAITEGTTDAVFVKDLRGRYLMINSAGASLLGCSVAEVVGKDDTELFSPETARLIMDADREVTASGQTQTYEEVGTAAGVTRTYLSTKGPYRDNSGHLLGLIGIARDITERKQLEEDLRRHAAELAEAGRAKDEFLAMLGHELRNPLAPIRNAVQLLHLHDPDEPRLRWVRDVVGRQVQQLTRLVEDLLDVSRITRGKIQLRKERVLLATVVASAIEMSRPLVDARKHELQVALPDRPVLLEGDPTRLAQVLSNLLNNAAKYTDEGGHIWLTAEADDSRVTIRVRDDGMGVPAEMLPRLFEMFAQGDRSPDRSMGGLGLGLTLVKRLVELHGGTVSARSDGPGRGSEFVVQLPLAREHAPASAGPTTPAPSATARPRRRVLIVDDNKDAAQSLALLLQLDGHEVAVAYDGPAGLEAARARRPDAILLDIGLPRMDGYEVARRLREQPEFRETLLVAVTGYGTEEDRSRSRDAGFDWHLVKPAEPADLRRLLAQPAAGKVRPDPAK